MKRFLAAIAVGLAAASTACAQAWPSKPVTLVVPFPPGGSTDSIARAIGPSLTKTLGQTFIIDNKAGATGTIGAAAVKRAPPDGYTFLVTSLGPLVIAPHLIKGMPALHRVRFAGGVEAQPGVVAHRLEQPVARLLAALDGHQRGGRTRRGRRPCTEYAARWCRSRARTARR